MNPQRGVSNLWTATQQLSLGSYAHSTISASIAIGGQLEFLRHQRLRKISDALMHPVQWLKPNFG